MRLIDADKLRKELNSIYNTALELRDLELLKITSVCVGLLDRSPTITENAINTQYEGLSSEDRVIVDSLIGALYGKHVRNE